VSSPTTADVREYWNKHIHDLDISTHQPGSREFFADLDQYHFEKLHHLLDLVPFDNYRGKRVLDVGCGAGTDLARFGRAGAIGTFDLVFAHGVVQYTPDSQKLVDECRRVLKPGGEAIFQVYNRISWLNALSKLMKVPLEHDDAPVLKKYSAAEFRILLRAFTHVTIIEERFPVKSRLHGGWKGALFNSLFVGAFNALPRSAVRRFGWHLLAFCRK
jgi:SAM-dependent methyltransferase